MSPDTCINCTFYCLLEPGRGQCRKNPPTLVAFPPPPPSVVRGLGGEQQGTSPLMFGTWPPVVPDGWCGEWTLKVRPPTVDGPKRA